MSDQRRVPAFTLIELLVVVSIISLLMSILLPSMSRARHQAKSAVCLSNLRQLGYLLLAYADEDQADQVIPIHDMMIRRTGNPWISGTGHSFVWGGRDGQFPLPGESGDIWLSGNAKGYVPPEMGGPMYGAAQRPLNRFYLGRNIHASDAAEMGVFRCPDDRGFSGQSPAVPPVVRGLPCYEVFGNSYQAQTLTSFIDDSPSQAGAFSWGVWGHRLQTLPTPGQLVLAAEPPLLDTAGGDWHARGKKANVLFVDGGARATSTQVHALPACGTLVKMDLPCPPLPCNAGLLSEGPGWRLDTWPTPGARIWGAPSLWTADPPPFTADAISPCLNRAQWPFPAYECNLE